MKRDKHLTHGFGQRSHKYIARVPNGRGYRYFYDADEYRAYQQGRNGGGQKRSVWNAVGAVGSFFGNPTVTTFANNMDHLHNQHNNSVDSKPQHPNRPHSRKVKIGRGTAKVRKGDRIGDYGLTIGSEGAHLNIHKPKPISSLDPSVKDYMKSTRAERKAAQKAKAKAFKEEQERKRREEEETERKREARRKANNHRYRKRVNAVRKAIYQLHKKRRKPSNLRPGGGGGSIDY